MELSRLDRMLRILNFDLLVSETHISKYARVETLIVASAVFGIGTLALAVWWFNGTPDYWVIHEGALWLGQVGEDGIFGWTATVPWRHVVGVAAFMVVYVLTVGLLALPLLIGAVNCRWRFWAVNREEDGGDQIMLFARFLYGHEFAGRVVWSLVADDMMWRQIEWPSRSQWMWRRTKTMVTALVHDPLMCLATGWLARSQTDRWGRDAWASVRLGEYERAIVLSLKAKESRPDCMVVDSNLAHALLLSGREREALQIYWAHRGKSQPCLRPLRPLAWAEVIRRDVMQMRQARIDHPLFDEIVAALKAG